MKKMYTSLATGVALLSVIFVGYSQGSISPSSPRVCAGGTIQFTVSGSSAQTGYTWSTQVGVILSGQGTKTVNIRFNGPASGVVYVSGNGLNNGAFVAVDMPPGAPSPISGSPVACPGATAVYTTSFSGPGTVSWVGTGATSPTIVSQSSTSATVSFPNNFTSGIVMVYASNGACPPAAYITKNISAVQPPAMPGPISGQSAVAPGTTGVAYSVPSVTGATSYQWSPPPGATIASGAGTTSVTVDFSLSFTGGNLTVAARHDGCTGPASSPKAVTLASYPEAAGGIVPNGNACIGQNGTTVTYTVPTINNATSYYWTYSGGTTPVGNTSSNSIVLSFPPGIQDNSVTVTVRGVNGLGEGLASSITTTVFKPVGAPQPVETSQSVCPGQTNVMYSVQPAGSNQTIIWAPPPNVTMVGSNVGASVNVNFSSTFVSEQLRVFIVNGPCGAGPDLLIPVSAHPVPAFPGTINGNSVICPSTSEPYSITPVSGAIGYFWSVPLGATITSGQNTNSITVDFSSSVNGGNISVYATNCSGGGPSSSSALSMRPLPAAAGAIDGNPIICPSSSETYSIAPVNGATGYVWTPSPGATITSGQNTTSVTVSYSSSASAGNISVYASNCMGGGTSSSLSVNLRPLPPAPGAINGNDVICPSSSEPFSITPVNGATGYVWSVPPGATITSGQNTSSVTVNFSSSPTPGNISVYPTVCSGDGPSISKAVNVRSVPGAPGQVIGNIVVCPGETNINYQVSPMDNVTGYTWSIPLGATIVSGESTNSILVNFSEVVSAGSVSVSGVNCAGNGPASNITLRFNDVTAGPPVDPSVDLATGTMSASLPLFTIGDGEIEVPGVLGYSATGVRVTDDDGWVGHNWTLSVQNYQIGREVRGLPDDYSAASPDNRKGWLNSTIANTIRNFAPSTDNNPATCADEVVNYNFLDALDYNQDTEPDVFFVNAPGLSFQFYFDENKQPRALPYQDVIITPNTINGPISSFTVTGPTGISYVFSERETQTQTLQSANNYYLARETHLNQAPISYATAWRLASVTSPVYGTVSFTYRSVVINDPNLIPKAYRNHFKYKYNYPVKMKTSVNASLMIGYGYQNTIKILEKISSSVVEAVFVSVPKGTGNLLERLNEVKIFDKRTGTPKLVRTISLQYFLVSPWERAFLRTVSLEAACITSDYNMEYYGYQLPSPNTEEDKDDWDFYKTDTGRPEPRFYAETAVTGTLGKITLPFKGYHAFFYEPHTYIQNGTALKGAGIRLRKMVSYDGVSSSSDVVTEYDYSQVGGLTSGKLQYRANHEFSVTTLHLGTRYRDYHLEHPGVDINAYFTVHSNRELSNFAPFRGSAVAYERVAVRTKDAGKSVYEFDLPASFGQTSANNGEWQASKVLIARPSVGGSGCYETPNITEGIDRYPFPPNPDYEFARALLKKVTNVNDDGIPVREVTYNYQRVYGNGSSIRKIYGLALEELPTYYYNGSAYQDNKLFLYSKYEIFTDVKTELNFQTETIYNSTDLSKKTVTSTSYFFDSPNHRELTRIETANSDGSVSKKKLTYTKDYSFVSASSIPAVALANLNATHRNTVVESVFSKVVSGEEKTIGASLSLYQTLSGKVYPYQQYSFTSNDGTASFSPSAVVGGSTFQFDQARYVLENTCLNFDSYGNLTESVSRDRVLSSVAYGYGGTLPVIAVSNAKVSQLRYSDFETSTPADFFITWPSPSYGVGRNNSKCLNVPIGGEYYNAFVNNISYDVNNPWNYVLSCWIKAESPGSLSVWVGAAGNATFTFPYSASSEFKYYRFSIPVATVVGNTSAFMMKVWSGAMMQIDDIAFYPDHADFVASTYVFPNGKNSETDSRGTSAFYDHDLSGRLKAVYDQNRNVIKKYDYQVRP